MRSLGFVGYGGCGIDGVDRGGGVCRLYRRVGLDLNLSGSRDGGVLHALGYRSFRGSYYYCLYRGHGGTVVEDGYEILGRRVVGFEVVVGGVVMTVWAWDWRGSERFGGVWGFCRRR